jgi:hypothetical protein
MNFKSDYSTRKRAGLAVLGLISTLLLVPACADSGLRALRPEFSISWPEELGYDAAGLDSSVMDFAEVTTGGILSIPVTMTNPGNAALDLCETYLALVTFDEDGELLSEQRTNEAGLETLGAEIASSGPSGQTELGTGSLIDFEIRFTPLTGEVLPADLFFVVKHELNWDCAGDTGEGLYIPVFGEGFGDPVPDIHSDPTVVEFANTEVGQTSNSHEIRVMNLGPGTLNITDVVLGNDSDFSIVSDLVGFTSLELNEENMIRVEFNPTVAGTLSTEVLISSNDPNEDPYTIQLVGIGEDGQVGKGPVAVCDTVPAAIPAGSDVTNSAPFETLQFDGSGSYDNDGLALSFQWVLTPPPGSASTLSSYTSQTPTISLDLAGDYVGSLTVTNTAGLSDSCTQTISSNPNENFRIEMFWQTPGDDMDLHLLEANDGSGNQGTPRTDGDCYYGNCNTAWSTPPNWGDTATNVDDPGLDLDDISGTGPENINISDPAVSPYDGWYEVFVHDYPGSSYTPANDVTVNIYLNGVLSQTYNFQISGEDSDYYVAKIQWPTGQIVPCNGLAGCP